MQNIEGYLLNLQQNICQKLSAIDGKKFVSDVWTHAQGGGGDTRVLQQGNIFEKAGVNFSHVFGQSLPASATLKNPALIGRQFEAMGISIVIHPLNPHVPTAHANLRFFIATDPEKTPLWWFGGGLDLTPYYGVEEDCIHWHRTAQKACQAFGENVYPVFKQQCDDYFFLKHRHEARGIGGLFFDDLNSANFGDFDTCFSFIKSIGNSFLDAYLPIVTKRKALPYGEKEKNFQTYRRGRYVEFNLIYDRGTLFGLQLGGRTESILISLPPLVSWQYDWTPEKNSPEEKLTTYFLKPKDWII